MKTKPTFLLAVLAVSGCIAQDADLILHHGRVVTADSDDRIVEAIAVRGDRILAVGGNDEVLRFGNDATRRVDLAGGMVLPGLTLALAAGTHAGNPAEPDANGVAPAPITVTLVSDAATIAPGGTVSVGILQTMAPGYHTYWKNPGTVGMATRMEWDLPDGFSAGEIQWPIPRISGMSGYGVWGYEGEALLVVDIEVPETAEVGTVAELKGLAAWMCCGAQCHPGNKTLSLVLPVTGALSMDPVQAAAFDAVRRQQPEQFDSWRVSCRKDGATYVLTGRRVHALAASDPGSIRFFGYDRLVSSDKPQQVRITDDGFVLRLPEEVFTPAESDCLRGILVASSGWEDGREARVMAVDVPVSIAEDGDGRATIRRRDR